MNYQSRWEMLRNRIHHMKQEAVDIDFIQYLIRTEESMNRGEFPIEYYENEVERNYGIYLQKNAQVLEGQKNVQSKNTFEFHVGAGLFSIVGILFILSGLVIFSMNYMTGFIKGIALYGMAIVLIVISELFIKKKQETICNVVTGLGICSIFAATIVNYLYLQNFNMIVAMVIVVLASVVTLFIGKAKNSVCFKLISLFGGYICLYPVEGVENGSLFLAICAILFVIHLTSILIPLKKESRAFMITGMALNLIYMIVFVVLGNLNQIEGGYIAVHIGLAAIIFYVHAFRSSFAKENSMVVFLTVGTLIYYFAFTYVLKGILEYQGWYYTGIILGIFLMVQLLGRIHSVKGIAAAVMIGTFIQYTDVLEKYDYYDLAYLAAFAATILILKNWKLFYELMITAAFLLYPLIHSSEWSYSWQTELNILVCSGILVVFFLIFNHAKWLENRQTKVYNWICIFILGILQLYLINCDNIFVFLFMLLVGITLFTVLFQERYQTSLKHKNVYLIGYLTYMGMVFPIDYFVVTNIIMTVIALLSVIIGFYKKEKPIRVYGLLLALFICAKIIIYDYRTVTQMQRMWLFFGVGIIILMISFVYFRLEKHLQQDSQSKEF